MEVTTFTLGTFAMLIDGSSWLAERICRVRAARSARAHLIARTRSYSVVREVGIRLRDTGAVASCVELNALRCSGGLGWLAIGGWIQPLRPSTTPSSSGRT